MLVIRSQVNLFSTRVFGEIPNLFLTHHLGARQRTDVRKETESNLRLRRLDVVDLALEVVLRRRRSRHRNGGRALHVSVSGGVEPAVGGLWLP
jgi:hypothetical protein